MGLPTALFCRLGLLPEWVGWFNICAGTLPLLWYIFVYPLRRVITWIEFHDQSWCPHLVRQWILECCVSIWRFSMWRAYVGQPAEEIKKAVRQTGVPRIIEVASGAGGAIEGLLDVVDDPKIKVTLTDLYPEVERWKTLVQDPALKGRIDYVEKPINACAIPDGPEYKGLRMIRASMHHFGPDLLHDVIQHCVNQNQPMCSLDFCTTRYGQIKFWFCNVFCGAITRPILSWQKIQKGEWMDLANFFFLDFFYAVAVLHDAFVTSMRAYSPDQFREICSKIDGIERYDIKAYTTTGDGSWISQPGNFFLLTPKASATAAH